MRINKLELSGDLTDIVGLAPVALDRLGSVVAIVGKNGSGKTRFLNLIESDSIYWFRNLVDRVLFLPEILKDVNEITKCEQDIKDVESKILTLRRDKNITTYSNNLNTSNPLDNNIKNELLLNLQKTYEQLVSDHAVLTSEKTRNLKNFITSHIRKISYDDFSHLIENQENADFEQLINDSKSPIGINEIDIIGNSGLSYFLQLPGEVGNSAVNAVIEQIPFDETVVGKRMTSLTEIVSQFLKKRLSRKTKNLKNSRINNVLAYEISGSFLLDDVPFEYSRLSEGEKILFAFAMLFYLEKEVKNIDLRECVIIIDEPELHLHPDVEIEVIQRLKEIISEKGQLIIATHSIPILSSLEPEEIFLMQNGLVTPPNRNLPGKTLRELMSLDEQLLRLQDFINNISVWSYITFFTECLRDPDVIATAYGNDPQVEVFKTFLQNLKSGSVLLDFGAGKGRLIKEIVDDLKGSNISDVIALEIDKSKHSTLLEAGAAFVVQTIAEVPRDLIDVAVLCNVLHEISLSEWTNILNDLIKVVKPDGYILFIEDKTLPHGEKIDTSGFHILDELSLQALFRLAKPPGCIRPKGVQYQDRIMCIPIAVGTMNVVNTESMLNCFESLEDSIWSNILEIRKNSVEKKSNVHHGRLLAFYSQHYINTKLAIREIIERQNNEKVTHPTTYDLKKIKIQIEKK